jgi:hypothetical protein
MGVDNMLKIETKKALEINAIHGFRGIANDGGCFYFTVKDENKIIKCDVCFNPIKCFETCRNYAYICYDSNEDCFWATDYEDSSCIYKLNNSFVEIGKRVILIPELREKEINGISHHAKSDRLFISYSNAIVSMEKYSLSDCRILFRSCKKRIRGVTDLFTCFICFGVTRPRQEIRISSLCGGQSKSICIPSCFRIESMVSVPNDKNYGESHLFILLTKQGGEQCVMECIVEDLCIYEHKRCCCDKLEEIAKKEAMIAHCINEESEKFINIINSSNNTREINAAMTSLIMIIDRAANEERELSNKLQKLMEHCDFCNEMNE